MTVETRVLSPAVVGPATKVSDLRWRKQLLPLGEIQYNGRRIKFDKDFLARVKAAHEDGAFDSTSLQLANDKGEHPTTEATLLNPERWRGEVAEMEVTDDGLFGVITVTPDMDTLLTRNPKLGVSCAIDQNYLRSDGKHYPAAVQHVLATIDPKIAGMAPWEKVTLSNEIPGETLDLSDQQLEVAPVTQPSTVDSITDEQIQEALRILEASGRYTLADNDGSDDTEVEETETTEEDEDQPSEVDGRVTALELQLARQIFNTERAEWVRSGVPPVMVDVAEPLLVRPGSNRIELSRTGDQIDAAGIVRRILNEAKGTLLLGREVGRFTGGTEEDTDNVILKTWEDQY